MKGKRSKMRVLFLCCILVAATGLWGCGGSTADTEIRQEEITYTARPVALPEYDSFDGAWFDGESLLQSHLVFRQRKKPFRFSPVPLQEIAGCLILSLRQ